MAPYHEMLQSASVPENYFDEPIATRYDTIWADLFDPAVVDPRGELPRRSRRDVHLGFEEYDIAYQPRSRITTW